MVSRRRALAAGLVSALGSPWVAAAAAWAADALEAQSFTQDAFAAAQKANKRILVDIHAPWCPICKRQAPVLAALLAEPRFHDIQRFDVDFDSQKDALRLLGARLQSTLITFKGVQETGRSIGQTQPEWLEELLEKLL